MKHRSSSRGPSSPLSPKPTAAQQGQASTGWEKRVTKATVVEKVLVFTLAHIKVIIVLFSVLLLLIFSNEVERSIPVGFMVDDPVRPGHLFDKSLIKTKLPVVFVPGFITTALELWEGDLCAVGGAWSPFRQRMLSAQSFLTMLRNPSCFLRHFSLDPRTAGDPEGVKVRPDSSFSSADYLVFGFWVWAKLIVNLADIGYDPNTMYIASYDWRLDAETAERRDKYFSRLRAYVEASFDGDRFVLVGHSYGSSVIQEFLLWADNRSPGWTETYVDSIFDIAGPFLGVPKAFGALISGEVKDTALMPSALRYLLDSHIDKPERTRAFRTWPCLTALLPSGGDCVWPSVLNLTDSAHVSTNLNGSAALHFLSGLMNSTGHSYNELNVRNRLRSFEARSRLPRAPSTTVYCVFGTGLPSETAYSFKPEAYRGEVMWAIDPDAHNDTWTHPLQGQGTLRSGVGLVDGDGTVPLISLGYPCRSPNGFQQDVGRVVTYEVPHAQSSVMDLRGGSATADHVDIIGNYDVISALLMVVTGNGADVHDRISSKLDEMVAAVDKCRA
ncbi:phospholipid:diacylglycerol acyltransferase-like, putative [Bodo saltans]|uniref:Phospholipid:diacylglycerol acyltransferase-like, putative n=1 Tax=Bodo saltans TaxID=75058 RepID=A0A0S4J6G5_BODSA|nr:phospholipid:diacylglycerol acyltransferase-like, putative [Bodo saltans]|eukprot:CUG85411.1 phospholipid:diacylglycerol acyltransferase-like, putative [Bodo saltans]